MSSNDDKNVPLARIDAKSVIDEHDGRVTGVFKFLVRKLKDRSPTEPQFEIEANES